MFYMKKLHEKVALLPRWRSLNVEQEILSEDFLERFGVDIYKTLIKRWVFGDSDKFQIRLRT